MEGEKTDRAGTSASGPDGTDRSADAGGGPASAAGASRATHEIEGHEVLAPWSDREEVEALPDILRPAEELMAVGSGTVVRSGRLAQSRWLVVLTDRRLLCIKGRDPATRKVIDMPISQIRGVEVRGLIGKTLSLDTGFGTLRVGGLDKPMAAEIAQGITRLMGAYDEDGHLLPTDRTPGGEGTGSPPDPSPEPSRGPGSPDAPGPSPSGADDGEVVRALESLSRRLDELTERVTFLEELVRSNVRAGAYDEERP